MIGALAILLAGLASAQDPRDPPPPPPQPSNLATTSVGAQLVTVPSVGLSDVDLLLAQRVRWSFGRVDDGFNRLWVDGRLTLDPIREVTLERARLNRAGVELQRGVVSLDLGRAPVRYGGARLVDGVQGRVDLGEVELGLWAGLAPDLFTTLPRIRPAGGPVVAWERSAVQASLAGEVAFSEDLLLDRAASLLMARATLDRSLDVSGRLDMDWVSALGPPHLADGQVLVIARPFDTLRVDALYNAFSSLRYLQTEPLDPSLRRFDQRLLDLGVALGIEQDFLDPTVNHLVGGGVRFQDRSGLGAAFRASADGRYRYHPNPMNRFSRAHAEVGLGEIPVGGALDLALDGALVEVDAEVQIDSGLTVLFEPTQDRAWAVDTSFRLLLAPAVYDGFGWYTDLFVDAAISRTWLIVGGLSAVREPDPDFDDLGVGAFARVSASIR